MSGLKSQIAEFIQYLRVEKNATPMTLKSYAEDMEGWLEYTYELHDGRLPLLENINSPEIRGYLAAMNEVDYAKSTAARRMASLRSFFRFAQRQGWCSENPAASVRNPKIGRRLPLFLSTDEINRLLAAPDATRWQGLRNRAILEVVYSTGIRVGELVDLNLDDLILDEGMIPEYRLPADNSYAALTDLRLLHIVPNARTRPCLNNLAALHAIKPADCADECVKA